MTTTDELNVWLDSIIENANYLRNVKEIPKNGDFRDALLVMLKEAEDVIDSASDFVNDYDESEW